MKWKDKLINDIKEGVKNNSFWLDLITKEVNSGVVNIHLAIFNEPFLQLMYSNQKTIESRFSINNVVPFNRIMDGDIVLVKRSGGNIEALFIAKNILYFRNLNKVKIRELECDFGKEIGWNIDPDFLSHKSGARYLTLIGISKLTKIIPVSSGKKDKTGWSIVKVGHKNTLFDL
jgi:hypothetical protein